MVNMYLLKYRIKNGDSKLKNKLNIIKLCLLLLIILPCIYYFKPFTLLKENLQIKSKNIAAKNEIPNEIAIATSSPSERVTGNIRTPLKGVLTQRIWWKPYGSGYTRKASCQHNSNIRWNYKFCWKSKWIWKLYRSKT